jgi:hypothetical protein
MLATMHAEGETSNTIQNITSTLFYTEQLLRNLKYGSHLELSFSDTKKLHHVFVQREIKYGGGGARFFNNGISCQKLTVT